MDIYIVTRMSGCKSDVPNLGVHLSRKSADHHFDGIIEDRSRNCDVHWDRECPLRVDDVRGEVREAYIEHKVTEYNKEKYIEMLRIEWYHVDNKEAFLEMLD